MFKYRKYNQDQESTNQYHSTVERKSASQASRPRKRKVDWQSSRRFIQFYVIVIVNIHSREISDWPKNGLPWLWTISYFSYNFRLVLKCSDYGLWLILTTSEETRRFSDCLQTTYTSSIQWKYIWFYQVTTNTLHGDRVLGTAKSQQTLQYSNTVNQVNQVIQ